MHNAPDFVLTHFLLSGKMIQAAAETAYDMVSPGTLSVEPKKMKRFPHHRLAHQPVDLREGMAKAYSVVKEVSEDLCGPARAHWRVAWLSRWLGFSRRTLGGGLGLLPTASADVCIRQENRLRWGPEGSREEKWPGGRQVPLQEQAGNDGSDSMCSPAGLNTFVLCFIYLRFV